MNREHLRGGDLVKRSFCLVDEPQSLLMSLVGGQSVASRVALGMVAPSVWECIGLTSRVIQTRPDGLRWPEQLLTSALNGLGQIGRSFLDSVSARMGVSVHPGSGMRVGLLGTGAIANKHAQAYLNIGFELIACSNKTESRGREFAARHHAKFVPSYPDLCQYPGLDFIDVCTFPDFHLEPIELCAAIKRPIMVQKPIAVSVASARKMIEVARAAGIPLGVMSQHRFDDSTIFLKRALSAGRLGKILQADAYVKWFRSEEYYSRPIKGSWETEGGGALINQAIHQVDVLLYLIGAVAAVQGVWQLGARHHIASEDVVNALISYESSATGVIQASTAFWPGYTERIEIHGTKGTAIISGDSLSAWDVLSDEDANATDPAPLQQSVASGSSDPMAISLTSFERQFLDFADAIRREREPLVNGEEGLRALQVVEGIYQSCREGRRVQLSVQ